MKGENIDEYLIDAETVIDSLLLERKKMLYPALAGALANFLFTKGSFSN